MCNHHRLNRSTFRGETWTVEDLERFWIKIDNIGKEWGLTYPKQQIELVTSNQMIEIISTIGSPCSYDHWSIGKRAIELEKAYVEGKAGLAYELVINSEPSIMYIMENNTLIQQGLVMAHAGLGHGSVFKNNFLFKEWTRPETILDYMAYSKKYIAECEAKHSPEEVEALLDICHALNNYGVSHHKRLTKRQIENRKEYLRQAKDIGVTLGEAVPGFSVSNSADYQLRKLDKIELPEENILYFMEKYSTVLEDWHREIIRIVRKHAEYFYPQTKTKILHEGWATFIEYMVFEELYTRGDIDEGGYLEFLRDHTNVTCQPEYSSNYFNGHLNPYSIGFSIFKDLYRMTQQPTSKEIEDYPEIANTDWKDSLMDIVKNYSDSDLIGRYLTENVIKDLNLFAIKNGSEAVSVVATAKDLDSVRMLLSDSLDMFNNIPRLEIVSLSYSKRLTLQCYPVKGKVVDEDSMRLIGDYIYNLWGHEIEILPGVY
jgi:spore cortex formation protein SpoVR/YcgB (stage V sporulation)